MHYQYPLQMSFKVVALGPQIYVHDAAGHEVFYVHMKAFKLKEAIGIFSDSTRSQQIFSIEADRIVDFSAAYTISDSMGTALGKIKREGMRSIFQASYLLFDAMDQQTHALSEDNAMIRVADGCLTSIPVIGIFSGYFFHPSYTIIDVTSGVELMRLTKEPAFFEGKFKIEALGDIADEALESRLVLSLVMMILLERARG